MHYGGFEDHGPANSGVEVSASRSRYCSHPRLDRVRSQLEAMVRDWISTIGTVFLAEQCLGLH